MGGLKRIRDRCDSMCMILVVDKERRKRVSDNAPSDGLGRRMT